MLELFRFGAPGLESFVYNWGFRTHDKARVCVMARRRRVFNGQGEQGDSIPGTHSEEENRLPKAVI